MKKNIDNNKDNTNTEKESLYDRWNNKLLYWIEDFALFFLDIYEIYIKRNPPYFDFLCRLNLLYIATIYFLIWPDDTCFAIIMVALWNNESWGQGIGPFHIEYRYLFFFVYWFALFISRWFDCFFDYYPSWEFIALVWGFSYLWYLFRRKYKQKTGKPHPYFYKAILPGYFIIYWGLFVNILGYTLDMVAPYGFKHLIFAATVIWLIYFSRDHFAVRYATLSFIVWSYHKHFDR